MWPHTIYGSISDQTPSLITSDPHASVLISPWCLALLSNTPILITKCWWVLIARETPGVTFRLSSAVSSVAAPLSTLSFSSLWSAEGLTMIKSKLPSWAVPKGRTGWIHGLNWGTLMGVGPYYLFCTAGYWIRTVKMISSAAKRLCLLLRRGAEIQSKRLDLKRNWLARNIRALINNSEIYGGVYFGV